MSVQEYTVFRCVEVVTCRGATWVERDFYQRSSSRNLLDFGIETYRSELLKFLDLNGYAAKHVMEWWQLLRSNDHCMMLMKSEEISMLLLDENHLLAALPLGGLDVESTTRLFNDLVWQESNWINIYDWWSLLEQIQPVNLNDYDAYVSYHRWRSSCNG